MTLVYTLDLPQNAVHGSRIERAERAFVDTSSGARFFTPMPLTRSANSTAIRRHLTLLNMPRTSFSSTARTLMSMFKRLCALALLHGRAGTIVWHDYGEWSASPALDKLAATTRSRSPRDRGDLAILAQVIPRSEATRDLDHWAKEPPRSRQFRCATRPDPLLRSG